jgi:hypothetical protein
MATGGIEPGTDPGHIGLFAANAGEASSRGREATPGDPRGSAGVYSSVTRVTRAAGLDALERLAAALDDELAAEVRALVARRR